MGLTSVADPPTNLIHAAEHEQFLQNAARARQLQRVHELRQACAADPTNISPDLEACVEIGGVLGLHDMTVRGWLDDYVKLTTWLPGLWELCASGRLDLWRARVFLDAAETLADEDEIALFSADVDAYFEKYDDPTTTVVRLSRAKLQRAAKYRAMKRRRKDREQTFSEAFQKRRAWMRHDDNGMGGLGVKHAVHEVIAADYRLTLIARKRCETDDEGRTLEQMKADTLIDLVMGRLEVSALTSDLEDDETADGEDPIKTFATSEVGAFARPVINVTVPITMLMGVDDEPGLLSGDNPIPAELVRLIATQAGATWYRLLTDEAGRFIELSTTSYAPTKAIWRSDVAENRTCVWPGCCRPAVQCHIDHRVAFPHGETCTANTWPLCPRHHMVKHAHGYQVIAAADGSYVFRTRHGTLLKAAS